MRPDDPDVDQDPDDPAEFLVVELGRSLELEMMQAPSLDKVEKSCWMTV
jgi:hypothetical protein